MGGFFHYNWIKKEKDKAYIAAVIRYTFTDDARDTYELLNLSQEDNNKSFHNHNINKS